MQNQGDNNQIDLAMTARDSCSPLIVSPVEQTLLRMDPGEVLEMGCPNAPAQTSLAEWCLEAGRRKPNPFAHYLHNTVVIEK